MLEMSRDGGKTWDVVGAVSADSIVDLGPAGTTEVQAYWMGWQAWHSSKSEDANPWLDGSPLGRSWAHGYADAERGVPL